MITIVVIISVILYPVFGRLTVRLCEKLSWIRPYDTRDDFLRGWAFYFWPLFLFSLLIPVIDWTGETLRISRVSKDEDTPK